MSIRITSRVSVMSGEGALSVFKYARELEQQGRSIIHLELGEPDFHPNEDVVSAAKQALDRGRDRYCAVPGIPELRQELAAYLKRTRDVECAADDIVIAPGCKIALFMAAMALIEEGDEVIYPEPGFPGYPSLIAAFGAQPRPFHHPESRQLQPDVNEIEALITPKTRVIILNSPSNPTGTVYTSAAQRRIAELAVEHDLCVFSDEIYARIVYGGKYESIRNLPGMAERTVIIDGFSKTFAMTGWRLGYVVAPPKIVEAMDMVAANSYTCVAEFTQYAAIEALRDRRNSIPDMLANYARRRELVVNGLNQVAGFKCYAPEGAFYAWVNVDGTGLSAEEVCRIMLEEGGVAAIPGRAFGESGANFVRFSFAGSSAQLGEAIERIRKVSAHWQHAVAAR